MELLKVLPLVVVLVALLPPFRAHVLIAGFLGGLAAMVIGGLGIPAASEVFFKGLGQIMGITSVMMFAATAMVLARLGSVPALLDILRGVSRGRIDLMAAGMVLVQALATYAAGIGAANTLVTAPVTYALVGFVPLLVAGLAIVSGASWATSPASAESAYISSQMGVTAGEYAALMRPYTVLLWIVGIVLAWYGVRRYQREGKLQPPTAAELAQVPGGIPGTQAAGPGPQAKPVAPEPAAGASNGARALPFFLLLGLILLGPPLNRLLGYNLFTTLTIPVFVLGTAAVSMRVSPNRIGELFIEGGLTILRYLFMVGVFLGFINMMGEIGTFKAIAGVVRTVPATLIVGLALVVAFVVAIPSAAYTVAIDALIIPILAAAGVPGRAFGFVGIAVAQGAMICPVQINVAATAHGFRTDILRIIRNNLPYMPAALVLTVILSVVAGLLAR